MMGRFGVGMNRQTFGVGVLGAILLLIVVVLANGTATGTTATCLNADTLTGSAFEIDRTGAQNDVDDANLKVDDANCIDWLASGADGAAFRSGVLAKNDKPTGTKDDSFGQGTAEDNPNPTIVSGSIPPNKSDLKAFGVFAEKDFLELFWSRVQNPSGTTNMDFELNQKFCDGTATTCANNGTTRKPVYVTPLRTTGDKLITYDLSGGGTHPAISIRTWSGSAWGPATLISGGTDPAALGSINSSLIPETQTGGATGGLTTALGSQDPFTFGEAAISFKALFGEGCGTFGSAYLKSRSSDSFNSEIKDFVAPEKVNISNCPSSISSTQSFYPNDTATVTGTGTLDGTVTFKLYRTQSECTNDTGSVYSEPPKSVTGSGSVSASTNNTTYKIEDGAKEGTYYWGVTYSPGSTSNNLGSRSCVENSTVAINNT